MIEKIFWRLLYAVEAQSIHYATAANILIAFNMRYRHTTVFYDPKRRDNYVGRGIVIKWSHL